MTWGALIFWLLAGAAAAAAFVAWARRLGAGDARAIYASSLVIAAAIYLLFAIVAGDLRWLGIEVLGLVAYGLFAWAGVRGSAVWIAAGWLLHPLWDVALHWQGPGSHVVPGWYAVGCLSFDVVVAAVILLDVRSGVARTRPPQELGSYR